MPASIPNNTYSSTVEIVHCRQNDGLALWNAFLHVSPLSSQFNAGFDSLCTRIHGKNHVVTEHLRHSLRKPAEDRVIECTRRKRQLLCLFEQASDNPGMAVSLEIPGQRPS